MGRWFAVLVACGVVGAWEVARNEARTPPLGGLPTTLNTHKAAILVDMLEHEHTDASASGDTVVGRVVAVADGTSEGFAGVGNAVGSIGARDLVVAVVNARARCSVGAGCVCLCYFLFLARARLRVSKWMGRKGVPVRMLVAVERVLRIAHVCLAAIVRASY